IAAVFGSWNNTRAVTYRRLQNIPAEWGTAVNVQAMVFGNMGEDCATGVAFTRNPSTGANDLYGEYLVNAQGEDVVAGIRTPQHLTIAGKRAAIIPCRSSGLVSRRTRITSSPRSSHSTAVAESKTALPTAAPGEALIALVIRVVPAVFPNLGNISCASCAPVTRRSASFMSIRSWSTSWTAIRNAAPAVRLPTLVCSIHSLPRSIVNSMSQRSL
ncbi:MAG TPA: PEP/pyruvate-binding domain-containing protein, partial [Streptosporangiaceae bacterium]|nr:PEP/pyruvate-binding domain-containing protein [Streptosporangiaceae bacterium]